MLLVLHIVAAVVGIALATLAVLIPSKRMVRFAAVLTGVTFVTGIGLVWKLHASLVSVCESGIVYLAVMGLLLATAEYRLKATAR